MKNRQYNISRHFRAIQNGRDSEGFIYHTLHGNGMIASAALISLLKRLSKKGTTFSDKDACLDKELFHHLMERGIVIPAGQAEFSPRKIKLDEESSDKIDHLRLCVTERCNMSCTYCYVDCGAKKTGMMTFDVAKKAIKKYHDYLRKRDGKGKITFFGGEPLLNWECLERSVIFINKLDPKRLHLSSVSLVTNGTLINKERAIFLGKYDINTGVSVDGPQHANDRARVMNGGGGSYKRIIRGLGLLQDAGVKKIAISCTVADHNYDSLNALALFAAEKKIPITIHPVHAGPKGSAPVSRTTVGQLPERFFDAFKFAKENNAVMTGTWMWPVKKAFGKISGFHHCAACGREFSVQPNGDVKPCPGSDLTYGSIDNFEKLLESATRKKLLARKAPEIKGCHGCPIEGLCGGGCMLEAAQRTGDVFCKGGNCEFMKGIFDRIIRDYLMTRKGQTTMAIEVITKGESS